MATTSLKIMEFDSANREKGMMSFRDDIHLTVFSTSRGGKVGSAINFGDPNVI